MENKEIIDKLVEVYKSMDLVYVELTKRHMKSHASKCMSIISSIELLKRSLLDSDTCGKKIKNILALRINKTEDPIEKSALKLLYTKIEDTFDRVFTGESKDE